MLHFTLALFGSMYIKFVVPIGKIFPAGILEATTFTRPIQLSFVFKTGGVYALLQAAPATFTVKVAGQVTNFGA